MTDEELSKLEQLATPGPWIPDAWHALRDSNGHLVGISTPPTNGWNDARFIAAAREAMPRLLAERERLLIERERLLIERERLLAEIRHERDESIT